MILHRMTGPECPKCGCRAGRMVKQYKWFGDAPHERRQCDHCGHVFATPAATTKPVEAPTVPGVMFRHGRTVCPKCGGADTPVTSTRGTLRHHKCRACKHCFKSSEGS